MRDGMQVTEEELGIYLAEKLTRYKLPRRIFFWDALPKSGYGKVPKRLIKDELVTRGLVPLVQEGGRSS